MLIEMSVPGDPPGHQTAPSASGNSLLCTELVRQHAPAVLAVCLANTGRVQDAEDLMQETFAKAFGSLESLRDRERARPWLLQIARRVCIDHYRRRTPTGPLPEDVPARSECHDPRIDRLHTALKRLPAEYRETISLYYLDGHDCAGVAASLGISPGAVRTRLLRGRVMLYDLLKEDRT